MWPVVLLLLSVSICTDARASLGYLAVNNKKVDAYPAKNRNLGFDSSGFYNFTDGEQAKFTCHRTTAMSVFTQFFFKNDKQTIDTGYELYKQYIELYVKLTEDYNDGYIDCIIKTFLAKTASSITRIFLKLKKTTPVDLGFEVNGLTLTPELNQNKELIHTNLMYQYFDGEEVTVRSLKDSNKYGVMNCSGENLPNDLWNFKKKSTNDIYFKTIMNEKQNTMSLECLVTPISSSTKEYRYVTLKLVPNNFNYSPVIKGLSMANVLVKYNSSTANTIYYEHDDRKELNLRCYSASKYIWKNSSGVEVFGVNGPIPSNDGFELSGTFNIRSNNTEAVISCVPSTEDQTLQITKVKLLRKKIINTDILNEEHVSNPKNTGTTNNEQQHNSTTVPTPPVPGADSIGKKPDKPKTYLKLYLIGAFVALVAIIVAVLTIIGLTKKKKQQINNPNSTDINYENLPDHKEAPMGVPSQWNEALYAAPADIAGNNEYAQPYAPRTTEELYSQPLPKHQRQGPSQPNNEEPGYAAVGDLGPTYAQALPKSIRRGQNYVQVLPKIINESPYTEVLHKRNRPNANVTSNESSYTNMKQENPSTKVTHNENPYAEVRTNENPYAEPNCDVPTDKYANVFDNQRYVNADSKDDYAEPAYCEINVKK